MFSIFPVAILKKRIFWGVRQFLFSIAWLNTSFCEISYLYHHLHNSFHNISHYSTLLYICYKIQDFGIPVMNTYTCPLLHPLYHNPLYHASLSHLFWNSSVFFMRTTSGFFCLGADDN